MKKVYKKKIKKEPVIKDLDTLLDEVKSKMGEEFYSDLVKSIDEQKWEYYADGRRDYENQHPDPHGNGY